MIVDCYQFALRKAKLIRPVIGLDRECFARSQGLAHSRQIVFGQRKQHRDGLSLGDHHQTKRVVGVDQIARIDSPQAKTARDWRRDARVIELQAGVVHGSLIAFELTFKLTD